MPLFPPPGRLLAARGQRLAHEAEAWLRENLTEPLTIPDLCRAVQASERTLHAAFRKHLGTSPKARFKSLRLDAARRDLLHGRGGTRVTDVALCWGFLHFGWFAHDYRHCFGETPSDTLRRARRTLRLAPRIERGAGAVTTTLANTAVAFGIAGLLTLSMPSAGQAQEPPSAPAPPAQSEGAELSKKLANPISDLVSVPFQFNWEQGVGPQDHTRFILNVQPVMPFKLSKDVNLIARVILPLVSQPALVQGGSATFGVSDVLTSFFLSPSRPGSFTWGAGPVVSFPSTSEPTLGTGKWSAGPTLVALKQNGPWTFGALVNQVWSFAGDENRADVSQGFFQPFIARSTRSLWTITLQSEATVNWKAEDDKWTVPINLIFAKLSSFGPFPASYQFGGGVFVAHPDTGPTWKIRAAIVILLPRRK